MEQLKQVLKFQFWILLTVALILPFVGWAMATSGLVTEAEARTGELTKLNDSLKSDANDPNKEWETGLEAINVQQAVQPKMAHKVLYERQLPLMTWPTKMPSDLSKFQNVHGEYYRTAYRQMVEDVRKLVKPYDEETQTGLVIYPEELLPTPDNEWVSQAPSAKQVEAAQEDLWLLSSLLTQIASVNDEENAKTQFEAPIRQIVELYLKGGSASKGAAAGGTKSSSSGSASAGGVKMDLKSMGGGGGMSGMGGMGGMGGGNSGGAQATAIASAKINPEDVLGAEQAAASDKPAASDSKSSSGGGKGAAGAMAMGGGGGSSSSSSRWSASNMGRYRDDKPEFKTRGFYLEVIMDHRRVPELLVALANADWPINVLYVQEADFKDEDLLDTGGGGGLGGMGSSRSMGAMGGGPMGSRMGSGGRPPGMSGGGAPPGMSMRSGSGTARGGMRSADDSDERASSRSPLDDPNLATVAIVGVMYIFKKPPEEKPGTTTPGTATPGTTPQSPAPTGAPTAAPVASAPATGNAAPASSAEAESENAADDGAKPEQPAPAGAAPDSKTENESEKGAAPGNVAPEKGPEKSGKS